ncbi:Rieske 2Fe-2S domain-containing protein [Oryzihumus sp.]|uniref:Rieske 2Fe-2S domain-containing protein n=1 Tax=Oryzihumus sp. TaxID=1968903 RepID=UPI002EDA8602
MARTSLREAPPEHRDRLRLLWLRARDQPGWLILPLRAFLGVTFTYAALQKFANPGFLDSSDPTSIGRQMAALAHSSPIGPLVSLSLHAPVLVGLLIATGELLVGVATLLGLWARAAAAAGALLALTFYLTVSWNTTPYYVGADIVFVFAWSVIIAFGAGGVLSLDAWLGNRARRELRLGPEPATVAVTVPRLRQLCARGGKCGLAADGQCTRLAGCPVFPVEEQLRPDVRTEIQRRTVVKGGAAAAAAGTLAVMVAALTAMVGRAVGGVSRVAGPASSGPTSAQPPSGATSATDVGTVASLPVGHGVSFTNPADGNPGWVVHSAANTFVAFSAVCTHAGCPVQYDPGSVQFVCPCHGGVYDGRTGQVLQGPPPAPLPSIPVHVAGGRIRVG